MGRFGDFQHICAKVPSYPWCNLFYRQLQRASNETLSGLSKVAASAPVGVNPECGILRRGHDGSVGNVGTVVVCALSMLVVYGLLMRAMRRYEALGRLEFSAFLCLYYYSLALKLLTAGGFLMQGSKGLVVLTTLHVGVVVALFGALLANAFLVMRFVDDAEMSTLVPFFIFLGILFAIGVYISSDIANGLTRAIGGLSTPPERLHSVPLFIITTIWPLACAVIYLVTMLYIVLFVLGEMVPFYYLLASAGLFIASQLIWVLVGRLICISSHSKIDGSFPSTILETGSVAMLYLAWARVTED